MGPRDRTGHIDVLPAEALRRFEVVNDGGTLIRLEGCRGSAAVADAIAWLDTVGVIVHRVVELPTDSMSPAHGIADAFNQLLGGGVHTSGDAGA